MFSKQVKSHREKIVGIEGRPLNGIKNLISFNMDLQRSYLKILKIST